MYTTHTHTHARARARARTHAQRERVVHQGNGAEEKVLEKRTVFTEDLKDLTEVE